MDSYSKKRKSLNTEQFKIIKDVLKSVDSDTALERNYLKFDNECKDLFTSEPIGIKLYESIRYIPQAGRDVKPQIVNTYKNLSIKGRVQLIHFIDLLIDNLYAYIKKWEKVKAIISEDKNNEIKRIK